jgi:hypothetical protein
MLRFREPRGSLDESTVYIHSKSQLAARLKVPAAKLAFRYLGNDYRIDWDIYEVSDSERPGTPPWLPQR